MKKLIVLAALVVLSGCVHGGIERLGMIGEPEYLPDGISPAQLYQVTSKGSNAPKITILATHECDFKFETVPVIVKHKRDGVDVEYRDHRVVETYDCGVNTLAWANEGSTKSQLINLGQTAIQGGAFAGGMRLLRPARYNSSTTISGGGANATSTGGSATQTTDVAASSDADSSGTTATTGPVTSSSTSDSASSSTADAAGGGTIEAPTTVSNDPIINNP